MSEAVKFVKRDLAVESSGNKLVLQGLLEAGFCLLGALRRRLAAHGGIGLAGVAVGGALLAVADEIRRQALIEDAAEVAC